MVLGAFKGAALSIMPHFLNYLVSNVSESINQKIHPDQYTVATAGDSVPINHGEFDSVS
jgi:hypothetical protein